MSASCQSRQLYTMLPLKQNPSPEDSENQEFRVFIFMRLWLHKCGENPPSRHKTELGVPVSVQLWAMSVWNTSLCTVCWVSLVDVVSISHSLNTLSATLSPPPAVHLRSMFTTDWLSLAGSHSLHTAHSTTKSHSTNSFRGQYLQVRWPNQQCQSTKGNQLVVITTPP